MITPGSAFTNPEPLFGGDETPKVIVFNNEYGHDGNVESRPLLAQSTNVGISPNCSTNNDTRSSQVVKRMRYLTCIAAIGGFLSGYNTGVISGALLPLTRVFHLSPQEEESIVTATIMAAFIFSLLGGSLNRVVGRRKTIMNAAAVFTMGAMALLWAQNLAMLILGEVLLGIGIGIESLTTPLYISEVAKPGQRGMLVSAYAFMVCFGQFSAGIVDGIAGAFPGGWRFMFGMAAVPGTIMFVGFLRLPESPAWLVSAGREDEATSILQSVRDSDEEVDMECEEIRESIRSHRGSISFGSLIRNRSTRKALGVGCALMVMQQCCGANVVMYFSATIYRMSGFEELTAIWLAAFTALAQLAGLTLSVFYVDKKGRRPLLLFSFAAVAVCLVGLQVSFYLARILSPEVDLTESDIECQQQPALIWDGVSLYCYDCSQIEGCGFCGGACVKGDEQGPFDPSICKADDWRYEVCEIPAVVSWMPVVFMVLYLVVFGIGAGGLPWTVNSELYPVQCRSLAVSISTGTNWLMNLLVSSTFLTVSDPSVLTVSGSFGLYAILTLIGVGWLYWNLPETKGASLDQLDAFFTSAKSDATTFTATDSPSLSSDSRDSQRYYTNYTYGSLEESP